MMCIIHLWPFSNPDKAIRLAFLCDLLNKNQSGIIGWTQLQIKRIWAGKFLKEQLVAY